MPRAAAGAITPDRGRGAPGSGGRTDGLRTRPVWRAGVGATEMATGVVVEPAVTRMRFLRPSTKFSKR
jgi:hypothetical protein